MTIQEYNNNLSDIEQSICEVLRRTLDAVFIESKIWHAHPVWFSNGNPIVGYSKQKAGIRLMFWSGASFGEEKLILGTGKFKDASIFFTDVAQIDILDLKRYLQKAITIQWDYKNIVKRKGRLVRVGLLGQ